VNAGAVVSVGCALVPIKPQRVPPVRLVRAIDRLRAGLQMLHRSTVPGNIGVLELATGAWTTQAMYVAAKLGVADELSRGAAFAADVAKRVGADPTRSTD
jgi:hypothetical protein